MRTGRKRRTLRERAHGNSSVDSAPLGAQEHVTAIRKIKRAEKYALDGYADVIRAATDRAKEGSAKHTELIEKYVVEPHKEDARERAKRRSERSEPTPEVIRVAMASLPVGDSGQQTATTAVVEIRRDMALSQGVPSELAPVPSSYAIEPGEKLCERCTEPFRPTRPHIQRFCSICGDENAREKARERKTRFLAKHATTM